MKPNAAIVMFAGQPFTSLLISSNIKWFKYEWIWEKDLATGFLNSKKQPLRKHENIPVFYRTQPTYNPQFTQGNAYVAHRASIGECYNNHKLQSTISDGNRYPTTVLRFNKDQREGKLHPTQKPRELAKYLIKTYPNPKDVVLDFCCGSGTIPVASKELKRKWIAIEKEKKYCDITVNRLKSQKIVLFQE